MGFQMRKTLKKIRKHLIKRVTLFDYYEEAGIINYKLQLSNFWNPKKDIEIFFINREMTKTLAYELKKNILTIQLPKEHLDMTDSRAMIKLSVNKKKMLITTSDSVMDYKENIIINNKYYGISVNKNINVINRYTEFEFNPNRILFGVLNLSYDVMNLILEDSFLNLNDDSQIKIYAFSNNKVREITATYDHKNKQVKLKDFSLFSIGLWQLFISVDNQLYPIENNEKIAKGFDTYHHNVSLIKKNKGVYLLFEPHILYSDKVFVKKDRNDDVEIQISAEGLGENLKYNFLINDSRDDNNIYHPLCKSENLFLSRIPLKELSSNFSNKRFFVESNGENPKVYQFNLESTELVGPNVSMNEVVEAQLVNVLFYRRKDSSLGLKVSRPRIRKMITKIEEFVLSGFVDSLDKFVDCQAYLLIEERNTFNSLQVPITEDFEVDLLQLDLIGLKSKGKTIMDLFILVKNTKGEVIRKEKIKYKHADYKKDNYYDYKLMKDKELNQQHFLITTTPFDNLKIETFSIPNTIIIPEDTSQKDENIWLIGERYNTAQDNGIVLFNWLQRNTGIEAYYVIESEALDYEKIKDNPNVLTFGSKKHFDVSVRAKVLLGTHDLENILPYKPARGFFHYEDTYKVLLQHGVLGRKNVEYHKKYYDQPFDLFIVSSSPEKYDVVMDEFGYANNEVAVTGLARFDNLIQVNKPKDILLMPTWRDWINTNEQFLESEYYATYVNLISNPDLLNLLENYNVNLNFYPHYRAQEYFNRDLPNLSERIKFIELGSKTVQDLLIDHALLITDFSSVSFDFTLMNKPVIYYHFDAKRFFRRGILRTIEETFIGKVTHSEKEIIKEISERLENNFENYDLDISNIIKYQDRHNSERIYKTIKSNLSRIDN